MAKFKIKEKTGGSNRSWNLSGQSAEAGTFPGILLDILDNDEVLVKDLTTLAKCLRGMLPGSYLHILMTKVIPAFQ